MRTNIVLDDSLVKEAMMLSGAKTKKPMQLGMGEYFGRLSDSGIRSSRIRRIIHKTRSHAIPLR